MLNGKTILVTGGTGSFGNAFTQYVLEHYEPKKSLSIPEMNLNNLIWQINLKSIRTSYAFLLVMYVIKTDCTVHWKRKSGIYHS